MRDDRESHLDSLVPLLPTGRRSFVVAALATGFALSVRPAGATIVTDSVGLEAGEVKIPVADGTIPGYRAKPAGPGPFPILLVVEEVFGVHEHIQDMCRRFAKDGYLAIAPELYARLGDPGALPDIASVIALVNRAPDTQTVSDLDATLAWAKTQGGDGSRAAITGWCRGGRTTWVYAAHNPSLKAAVAWYGPLGGAPSEAMPTSVIDLADRIKVPVLGLYAGQDGGIPAADIATMSDKLKAAHADFEFHVYPDAQHGFNADYRPSYNAADATDAMHRCLEWLKRHGAA